MSPTKSKTSDLYEFLLRLGDNALILSQRLGEWCGHGPILEEDMALTNVALDLLGQARLWLQLAAAVEDQGRTEDQLAFLRDAGAFRNLLLVEQPNATFAETMARQFYFDNWHYLLLGALRSSSDPRVADIAAKAHKEVTYHLQRSSDWIIRLGDGTDESRHRIQRALNSLWEYTGEMFETDATDRAIAAAAIAPAPDSLRQPWLSHLRDVFAAATLAVPGDAWMQRGGKRGIHSEHLGYLLAEMQFLQRAYPGAQW